MKHEITFYTPDDQVSEIKDIRVSFLDQDNRAYIIDCKKSEFKKKINNINQIITDRINELNEQRELKDE